MFNPEEPKTNTAPVPPKPTPEVKLQEAIDNNKQNSPQLSLDPKSSKMSVVGDPNQVQPTTGDYELTFLYPAEDLDEEDKARMTKDEYTGEYAAKVKYEHRRVKPLYRTKVTLTIARILESMGVVTLEGYNSKALQEHATEALVDHIEEMADLARMVLGVPREQMEYMDSEGLADFFGQLFNNEPNIIAEAVNFTRRQLRVSQKQDNAANAKPSEKPNTPQS